MPRGKSNHQARAVTALMAEKSKILSQAQAFSEMGLDEAAQPLWLAAASREERISPLLESLGRDAEAALHRISAASCYRKAGEFSSSVNLYRAALAGPLPDDSRIGVQQMLADCLAELRSSTRELTVPAVR